MQLDILNTKLIIELNEFYNYNKNYIYNGYVFNADICTKLRRLLWVSIESVLKNITNIEQRRLLLSIEKESINLIQPNTKIYEVFTNLSKNKPISFKESLDGSYFQLSKNVCLGVFNELYNKVQQTKYWTE